VTTLVAASFAEPLLERSAGLAGWLGQSLHRTYQESASAADPDFEAELALEERFDHRGWQITLRGRADGVRPDGAGWLVEELKSRPPPGHGCRPAWSLQAALYARMLERTRGGRVRADLVLLGASEPERQPVKLSPSERDEALARGLDHCLEFLVAKETRRAAWREAAPRVVFPFAGMRPGQAEIQESVERTLRGGGQLLLEAGTGSGKTAAILTSALRHAMETGHRLVVLTASTLQQHLALETLARLAPGGVPLVARLRARRRMCTRGDVLCESCDVATRPPGASLRASSFDERGLALPGPVYALAEAAGVCPYALQREAAGEALVTVCDFNYAVDPAVRLPELRDPAELRDRVIVVDEVHQLPARARDALSVRLDGAAVRAAIEAAALGGAPLHRAVREACEALGGLLEATVADAGPIADGGWIPFAHPHDALQTVAAELRRLSLEALLRLEGAAPGPIDSALLDLGFRLEALLAEPGGAPGLVSLVGREGGAPQLERFCQDPSPTLRRLFGACHAVIGCSATLSPPEWFLAELGFDPARAHHERILPPDRTAQRAVVIDTRVTTTLKQRSREIPRIARRLAALCGAVPGNCMALFPSYAFLEAVRNALPPLRRQLRVQQPGDAEPERSAHVDALRADDDVLLLAVAGGALAEGVDYAGTRLRAVAVVGPCPPGVDAHRSLLAEHYAEQFDRGFELAYAVPGMIRVVQSAGRLLRGEDDRGVIALFDRRFLREPYRSLLPDEWLGGGNADALVGDPAEVARAFFGRSSA
jgi:DNA excision repair protein ERCC-2